MEETLEEAFKKWSGRTQVGYDKIDVLNFGAKWQQEDIIKKLEMHILVNEHDWNRNPQAQFRDFIEKFKK